MTNAITQLAAFDFDGTLARGDSLSLFLVRLLGRRRFMQSVLRHSVQLGMVGIGKADRDLTKERFIAHALAGCPAEDIHSIGRTFAEELITDRLFPEMVERVAWHKEAGHHLAMVSATLDVYLTPLAKALGFETLFCTTLEIVDGRVTGNLVGTNVRAAEKARQLSGLVSPETAEIWAYGNSSGDYEMLEFARHPYWVNRKGMYSPWAPKPQNAS